MEKRLNKLAEPQTWRMALAALSFLSAFGLITGNLGHLSPQLNHLLSFLLLVFSATLLIPFRSFRITGLQKKYALFAAGMLLFGVLSWLLGGEVEQCLAVLFLLLFLIWISRAFNQPQTRLSVNLLAALLISLYVILYEYVPPVWNAIEQSSQFYSRSLSHLIGENLWLGATASGMHLLVFFLLYALSFFLIHKPRSWKLPAGIIALGVFINALYLLIHGSAFVPLLKIFQNPYHKGHSHYHAYTITSLNTSVFFLAMLIIPLFFIERMCRTPEPLADGPVSKRVLLASGIVLLGILALTYSPIGRQMPASVFLYDRGYLNWDRPVFGQYGERSTGMFGMLPEFLQAAGYSVKRSPEISDETLGGCSTLVIINLQQPFAPGEHEAIWRFVNNGGSLLALGDHTGLAGIREPFNDLLKPVGIEFNFDSAHYIKDWDNSFGIFPHPLTFGLSKNQEPGISIGASLNIPASASPIVIAKYGYSDLGNVNNAHNAFLGDRQYNPGELLGDIVLVSAARHGKGKVLVFGDTSSFQNASLVRAHGFVRRVFDWLASSDAPAYLSHVRLLTGLALIGLGLLLLSTNTYSISIPYMAVAILIGLFASKAVNSFGYDDKPFNGNIALIDSSHMERFSFRYESDESFLGLSFNLMRNGFLPLQMDRFSRSQLQASKLLVAIAPTEPFTHSEIEDVKQFIAGGGTFLLCAGWEEASGSQNILQEFAIGIENVPLGPVDAQSNTAGAQFYNAWPVRLDDPQSAEVVCALSDPSFPLIVKQNHGSGRFIFIADTGFLTNANLESFRDYYIENIAFFRDLIKSGSAVESATLGEKEKQ